MRPDRYGRERAGRGIIFDFSSSSQRGGVWRRGSSETGAVDEERYRNYRNMVEEFDEGPYRAGGKRGNQGI